MAIIEAFGLLFGRSMVSGVCSGSWLRGEVFGHVVFYCHDTWVNETVK